MIGVLSKPPQEIDITDIEALIQYHVPEGQQIEYKKALSAKAQDADPWAEGQDRISDRAKNSILKEAVAFANAYGGALLIGIEQSDTKPPLATGIAPIPRCAELAERLNLVFRDRVEPLLPRPEIFAVRTDGESGVVIIRLSRSRLAPHRITGTLVCPVRRADRCEDMSMREIQDMTLNVSRGLERLEKALSTREDRFSQEFQRLATPEDAYGMRLTGVPVGGDVRLAQVFHNNTVSPECLNPNVVVFRQDEDGTQHQVLDLRKMLGLSPYNWRPMVRAARAEEAHKNRDTTYRAMYYMECHCDGLVELGFVSVRMHDGSTFGVPNRPYPIAADSPVAEFVNLAIWANQLRNTALAPASEYALEIEIRVYGGEVPVFQDEYDGFGKLRPGKWHFPRYSLGDAAEVPTIAAIFERDFWHSLGRDVGKAQGTFIIKTSQ